MNVPKIKGTHTAIKSGMIAAESIFDTMHDPALSGAQKTQGWFLFRSLTRYDILERRNPSVTLFFRNEKYFSRCKLTGFFTVWFFQDWIRWSTRSVWRKVQSTRSCTVSATFGHPSTRPSACTAESLTRDCFTWGCVAKSRGLSRIKVRRSTARFEFWKKTGGKIVAEDFSPLYPVFFWIILDPLIKWLIDWLISGLTDWLIGWLVDWLIDWLIDWLVDWLVDWWIDWLVDWLID